MSGRTIIYLHCDGDDCRELFTPDPSPKLPTALGDTLADQRRDARKEGWRTNLPGGKDLCPECR